MGFSKKKEVVQGCTYTAEGFRAVALQWMLDLPFSGLLLKPGLGKTGITLEAFRRLKEAGEVDVLLVAAKSRIIYSTWPNEIDKWNFPFTFHIMHEDKDKISKMVRKTIVDSLGRKSKISVPANVMNRKLDPDADVWLINYEGFDWLLKELRKTKVYKHKRIMCAIDESSKIGNHDTTRFRKLFAMAKGGMFTRRHILTGSPAANGLLKIFPQIKFLDLGAHFGTRLGEFRLEYFSPCGFKGYQWKVLEDGAKRIFDKLKDICVSFGEEELDLPPLLHIHRPVLLPEDVMEAYKELEKEHVVLWGSNKISAETAGVKSMKLRQLASGGVYDEDGIGRQFHTEKVKEVQEIIEESQEGSPILVGFEFTHELEALKKEFPKATFYSGKTGLKEGKQIEADWNKGLIPLLIAQLSSVAHGLNLQESGYTLVIYTLTWDLEMFEQFLKRLHRPGQKNTVRAIHLVAEGTADETVLETIQQKDANQQMLFNALLTRAGKEKRTAMIQETTGNAVNILRQYLKVVGLEIPPYAKDDNGLSFGLGVVNMLVSMGHTELQNFIYATTKSSSFADQSLASLVKQAKTILFNELKVNEVKGEYVCNLKTLKSFKIKIVNKAPPRGKPTPEYLKVIKEHEKFAENQMKGKRSKELDEAQDVDYTVIENIKPKVKRPRAAKVTKEPTKPAPPKTKAKSNRSQFGKRKAPFTPDKEVIEKPKKRRGFGI